MMALTELANNPKCIAGAKKLESMITIFFLLWQITILKASLFLLTLFFYFQFIIKMTNVNDLLGECSHTQKREEEREWEHITNSIERKKKIQRLNEGMSENVERAKQRESKGFDLFSFPLWNCLFICMNNNNNSQLLTKRLSVIIWRRAVIEERKCIKFTWIKFL